MRKPFAVDHTTGRYAEIGNGDTIDPSILPASSSSSSIPSDIAAGNSYTVAAGTQQVATGPITVEGTLIVAGNLRIT